MKNLLDYTQAELSEFIQPKFRTKEIYEWIYKKNARSFDEMSNLPKDIREKLKNEFYIEPLEMIKNEISSDGSIKYLFKLTSAVK